MIKEVTDEPRMRLCASVMRKVLKVNVPYGQILRI
jgi:hypothetical protein